MYTSHKREIPSGRKQKTSRRSQPIAVKDLKAIGGTRWLLTSWLKMADENETAPMPEKEDVEDHGHCSDCENEEHHFDDG